MSSLFTQVLLYKETWTEMELSLFINDYGKCSKISNTLKLRTPKIIVENDFKNILKNRTLTFFWKMNF